MRLTERFVSTGTHGGGDEKKTGGKDRRSGAEEEKPTLSRNVGKQLCNVPDGRRPQLHCGGSPKSRISEGLRDKAEWVSNYILLTMRKYAKIGSLFSWTLSAITFAHAPLGSMTFESKECPASLSTASAVLLCSVPSAMPCRQNA